MNTTFQEEQRIGAILNMQKRSRIKWKEAFLPFRDPLSHRRESVIKRVTDQID